MCSALKIKSNVSTAYHPETDGQTERVNQTLEQYLRIYTNYQQDDWCKLLPLAEFAYNNSPHQATGMSLFFANKDFHPSLTVEITSATPAAARVLVEDMQHLHTFLREQLKLTKEQYERATVSRCSPALPFEKESKVWLDTRNIHTKHPMKKLDHRRIGPFEVLDVLSTHARRLALSHNLRFLHNVFHVNLLEPYVQNTLPGQSPAVPPPVEVEGVEEFKVEEILNSRFDLRRRKNNNLVYTVKWVGYSDPTDEPEDNLQNAPEAVKEFHTSHPLLPGPHNRPELLEQCRSRPL